MPGGHVHIDGSSRWIAEHITLEGLALDGDPADRTRRPEVSAHDSYPRPLPIRDNASQRPAADHLKGNTMRPQAAAMKALLGQPGLQIMPGCGDGMGARLIQEAGFPTGFASGSSISAMRLAMPDMDLLTLPEMADAV